MLQWKAWRSPVRWIIGSAAMVNAAVGCASRAGRAGEVESTSSGAVPAFALQEVPENAPGEISRDAWRELTKPGNVLDFPPGYPGRIVWNTLYVTFYPGVSRNQKQALLDSVHAVVVGGLGLGSPRAYHVMLTVGRPSPPDSSSGPVLRARAFLVRSKIVKAVLLDDLTGPTGGR